MTKWVAADTVKTALRRSYLPEIYSINPEISRVECCREEQFSNLA
jgi:hypothetical protein